MKIYKRILISLQISLVYLSGIAQTEKFDEKIPITDNLYKVMANNRWGLVDNEDNLILSVEYSEPLFMDGKAVLMKYGSDQIEGLIDSVANFTATPPYYININFPYITDGMLAVKESSNGKWGFLNTDTGELLYFQSKGYKLDKKDVLRELGITGKNIKGNFVFDFAAPFVENIAAVYTDKTGWHHIDKNGKERFINPNLRPTLFRTSVNKGEAIIFDDRGIVLCMETPDGNAGIIKYIDEDYELKKYNNITYPYTIKTNGSVLTLNSKFQADKYEKNNGDSIIFIERPKIIQPIAEPVDSFTLNRDITVALSKKTVSANAKGTAAVTLNISNIGEFNSKELSISVNINGTKKSWEGIIDIGTTHQITLYVPAKFSAASISRNVQWLIKSKDNEISGNEPVTIKRYKPSRR